HLALLLDVAIEIVNFANVCQGRRLVIQYVLDDVWQYLPPAEICRERPAQIVKGPVLQSHPVSIDLAV
ncbi:MULTISPECIES: hypothetical protein, partial [unclassified Mesorhizobium]|uniref:hypothetical protein n=1 Tax=unclassified Mesorhizobium TaxID=325217 RepID=UPI001FDFF595